MSQSVPAFIDLQVNGHGGVDLLSVSDSEEIRKLSRSLLKEGVGAYQPTLITGPISQTLRVMKLIEEVRRAPRDDESEILGIHLEGPFLSPARAGTHPKEYLEFPTQELLGRYLASGTVTMLTLAPELPGGLEAIKFLTKMGVIVSLGHSDATLEQARAGFEAGASTVTHLWNAMDKNPLLGIAAAALEREEVAIQLIVDGVHLTDEQILYTVQRAPNRFILTNDAVAAAGLGDGIYPFGSFEIEVKAGRATRSDGVLAGGVGDLKSSLARLLALGVEFDSALASVTSRPAHLIGRPELGQMSLGGRTTLI